jgi:hypothetical protein
MNDQLRIVRALKDKDHFRSLTREEQQTVLAAGGIGASDISDESLESVSSGLEGGGCLVSTTGTDIVDANPSVDKSRPWNMRICIC